MKNFYRLSTVACIVLSASVASAASYDFSPENSRAGRSAALPSQRLAEAPSTPVPVSSQDSLAELSMYPITSSPTAPTASSGSFEACSEITIPEIEVSSKLNLLPDVANATRTRLQYFLKELQPELQRSVSLAPIWKSVRSENATTPGILSEILRQFSSITPSPAVHEYVCSAVIPTARETEFAISEAAEFYYDLATFLYSAEDYKRAEEALSSAFIYEESIAFYELAQVLTKKLEDTDRQIEYSILQTSYIYNTQGPNAAFELLSDCLHRNPSNTALRQYATKLLLTIDPERASKMTNNLSL